MWKIRLLGAVLALVGLLALLSACGRLWLIWRLRRGVRATGTVVEHVSEENSLQPVIQFRDQFGAPRSFTPHAGSSWRRAYGSLPVGMRVEVAYLPEDPDQVRLFSDTAELNSDTSLEGRATRFFHLTVMSPPFPGVSMKRQEIRLRRKLRKHGTRTVGTVVAEQPSEFQRKYGRHLDPKIQFRDQRGESVTFVHRSVHTSVGDEQRGLPAIGEQVEIVYLPGSPEVARMTGAARTAGDLAGRFAIGLLVIAAGLLLLLVPPEGLA